MATEKMKLNVEGMSCSHCENRVKKVVGALNGVQSVAVDLAGKSVTVEFDAAQIGLRAIADAIEEQGYDVK